MRHEPGPYRLDFYFQCAPAQGFRVLRMGLESGEIKPRSPEIRQMRLIPLTDVAKYDIFSSDARFMRDDLPRLEPAIENELRKTLPTALRTTDKKLVDERRRPKHDRSPEVED